MPFNIIRDDISRSKTDAVVNAANTSLQTGGGVCGAIFKAAGAEKLLKACNKLAPINTGEAVITEGFNLPAKYIIHTAGPVYRDGKQGEEALLRSCYINALELAVKNKCESIAFPLISSGIFGYPKAEALRVASTAIRDFISENDIDVSLVVFDKEALAVSEELLGAVESYIDEHYIDKNLIRNRERQKYSNEKYLNKHFEAEEMSMPIAAAVKGKTYSVSESMYKKTGFEKLVSNLDESFSSMLIRLINATGKKDSDIYRCANIDRRLYSKIKSNTDYTPSKPTVLAFAVALKLTLDQTTDLLERAGFALSRSRKFDVIVEYFIENQKYDIFEINEVLFNYDQPLLGGA